MPPARAEIRRNARYRTDDDADLTRVAPINAGAVSRRLRATLDEAEAFVCAIPAGNEELIFLEHGMPVQPDPAARDGYEKRAGHRAGYWPSSPEIGSAMLCGTGGKTEPDKH